jgi:hypothetical protein
MRICALLAICGLALSAQEPGNSPEREQRWRQDLQFLTAGLKAPGIRIAGGIATKGQKDFALLYPHFDAEIASIESDLPQLTDAEVLLRLMKLIASAHVVHNRIQIPLGMGFANRLPVEFHWFADGLAVITASPDYASTLGARVLSIGGKTRDQFLQDLAPYISHENESALRDASPGFLSAAGVLRHFQMVSSDGYVALRLQQPGGEEVGLSMPLVLGGQRIGIVEGLHLPQTIGRSQRGYYWHRYLEDSQSLYIQYNVCENDPKERFSDFARKVLADADSHAVKRVVIDLRNNGGGNEHVIGPLKDGLASRLKKVGPIYVLIGPGTQSSAVENAATLRKELSAKLIGEPSGGMPGGYGEVSTLTLPNSKLVVRFTTKGSPPKADEATTLTPDIAAPLKLADYLAGRDPALEAAMRGH